ALWDGRRDDRAASDDPKAPPARSRKRGTRDTGKRLWATNGRRIGIRVLIGRFSYHAPSCAARAGAAGMNRFAMECPGAGLCAGFRVKEPAPGKDATFSGKPRNPDECVHAHAIYPTKRPCVSILTVVRPQIRASRMRRPSTQ